MGTLSGVVTVGPVRHPRTPEETELQRRGPMRVRCMRTRYGLRHLGVTKGFGGVGGRLIEKLMGCHM